MPEDKKVEKKDEKVQKKDVAVTEVKQDVSFYLLKSRKWRTLINIGSRRVQIGGENSIVNVSASDQDYDVKVNFMRSHKGNQKHGGTEFVELSDEDKKPGGECLLDSLVDLNKDSLLNVLSDKSPKNRALSRGSLMMLILKEKGSA